jgi:hypothetical protein
MIKMIPIKGALLKRAPVVTADSVRKLLYYSVVTGRFYSLVDRYSVKAGDRLGSIDKSDGYGVISLNGRVYQAHRLAWLYVTGEWPEELIDHANRDRSNNAWHNIRSADMSQNNSNVQRRRDNTSGYKGVTWRPDKGKWQARVWANGKAYSGGHFADKEQANLAAIALRNKLHGEFANHA